MFLRRPLWCFSLKLLRSEAWFLFLRGDFSSRHRTCFPCQQSHPPTRYFCQSPPTSPCQIGGCSTSSASCANTDSCVKKDFPIVFSLRRPPPSESVRLFVSPWHGDYILLWRCHGQMSYNVKAEPNVHSAIEWNLKNCMKVAVGLRVNQLFVVHRPHHTMFSLGGWWGGYMRIRSDVMYSHQLSCTGHCSQKGLWTQVKVQLLSIF